MIIVAIDVETKGLDWKDPAQGLFGIAVTTNQGMSEYIDVRDFPQATYFVNDWLKKADKIVNHNIKFDIHHLLEFGIDVPVEKCECTSIRAALIDEHLTSMSLDSLAKKYLNASKVDDIYEKLAALFGGKPTRKEQIVNLHRAPKELVAPYALKDVELALQLWQWQEAEIERQGLQKVWNLERELFPVIVEMERGGVRIDTTRAYKAVEDITIAFDTAREKLHAIAGWPCNHNPSGDIQTLFQPKQVGNDWVLCDGTIADVTPQGKPSIGSAVLKRMSHPAAALILECRKLAKTRDTFLKGHIISNLHKGRLHANINQVVTGSMDWAGTEGTKTGRFSMSRPALQQIPARDKNIAAIIRPLFLPDEGEEWLSIDYRQFEFRIFAHYVNSPAINKMYADNPDMDFHQLVADIAGIPRNATEAGGPNAKQVNLGVLMGMGEGKMAKEMLLPYTVTRKTFGNGYVKEFLEAGEEAKEVIAKYHAAIPGVQLMSRQAQKRASERGYVFTLMGRYIRYKSKSDVYKAPSNIYQGGAADCLKQKLIEVNALLKREGKGRILLSVHDEINLSIPKGDVDLRNKIIECMETFDGERCPIALRVPIKTDPGVGENWAAASGKGC